MIEINWNPSPRLLRQFAGGWFPAFCAIVGAVAAHRTHSLAVGGWIWGLALAVSVVCFIWLPLARLLFLGWTLAAYPIGWTVSHLLLGAIFFLLITPIGWIMRLAGNDRLGRKFDRDAGSYWIPHETPADSARYFRQF